MSAHPSRLGGSHRVLRAVDLKRTMALMGEVAIPLETIQHTVLWEASQEILNLMLSRHPSTLLSL